MKILYYIYFWLTLFFKASSNALARSTCRINSGDRASADRNIGGLCGEKLMLFARAAGAQWHRGAMKSACAVVAVRAGGGESWYRRIFSSWQILQALSSGQVMCLCAAGVFFIFLRARRVVMLAALTGASSCYFII